MPLRKNQLERAAKLRSFPFAEFYEHCQSKSLDQRISDYCVRYGITRKEFEKKARMELLARDWAEGFYPARPFLDKNETLKQKLDFLEEKLNHQRGVRSHRRNECPF